MRNRPSATPLRILSIVVMLSALVLSGCFGSGGGGGGGGGNNGSGGNNNGPLQPIIPSTTKVLSDPTAATLTSVSPDQATLTFAAPNTELSALAPGDVVVVPITALTPDGLLRKIVTAGADPGGTFSLTTTQAGLLDAIEQGEIDFTPPQLTPADIESATFIHEGVGLVPTDATPLIPGAARTYSGLVFNINDQLAPGLRLKGHLNLSMTPSFKAKISGYSLQQLTAQATADESAGIRLIGDYQLTTEKEKKIGEIKFSPKVVWVGWVPVYIRPVIELHIGANAGIASQFTTGVDQALSYTAGIQYGSAGWGVINNLTKTFNYTPPTLDASLTAKGYVTPKLVFYLYGVGGPYLGAEGNLTLTATLGADPWCHLSAGLGGKVGVTGKIIGASLGDVSKDLFNIDVPLYQCRTPYLVVAGPGDIAASGVVGGPFTPASGSYTLKGLNGSVNWTASSDVPWLDLAPASGTADTVVGNTLAVGINAGANSLAKGDYLGTITLTNTSNGHGNTKRHVQLRVREQSMTVEPGPDTYLLSAQPEGGPFTGLGMNFTLNSDFGALNYTVACDAPWLTVSSTSGSVTAGVPVTISLSVDPTLASQLPATTQVAHVTFTNATNHKGDTVRSLFLQPTMNVGGGAPTFNYPEGGPGGGLSQALQVSAINAPIAWTATASQPWITLSAASGTALPTAPSTVNVGIDDNLAKTMAVGSYTGTVTLTNTGSGDFSDTKTLTVTLNVQQPLQVTPSATTAFSGPPGGPFNPTSVSYSLSSNFALSYQVTKDVDWLTVSPVSGTLQPGTPMTVTVSAQPTSSVQNLNTYTGHLTFTKTGGVSKTMSRTVQLTVANTISCTTGPTTFAALPAPPSSGSTFLDLMLPGGLYTLPAGHTSCFLSNQYLGDLEIQVSQSGSTLSCYMIDNPSGGWTLTGATPNLSFTPNYSQNRSNAFINLDTNVTVTMQLKDAGGNVLGNYAGTLRVNSAPLSAQITNFVAQ